MSKEKMIAGLTDNIRESMGAFRNTGASAAAAGPRAVSADKVGRERSRDVWTIEVDRVAPDPDQPRKEFEAEALERLAESLRTRGQLQPIQVRWNETVGRFVILMGERRWRAAQIAGLKTLTCVVREGEISDGDKLSIQLVENCLREDLSPVEQSKAFRTLMDRQGWTQDRLAAELAISQTAVAKALSLLKLPETIQEQVEQGGLTPSAAYELAKLDDPSAQIRLAKDVVEQGLTRDDVVKQVRSATPARKKAGAKPAKKLPPAMVWRLNGYRVEVARKAGVDTDEAIAVLEEAVARLKASRRVDAEAA